MPTCLPGSRHPRRVRFSRKLRRDFFVPVAGYDILLIFEGAAPEPSPALVFSARSVDTSGAQTSVGARIPARCLQKAKKQGPEGPCKVRGGEASTCRCGCCVWIVTCCPDRCGSIPGSCGKRLRRNAVLHCCKPGFAVLGEPARRMRRAPAFHAPDNK
jgi:hypothetical protein